MPASSGELLARVSASRVALYEVVRQCLDQLEAAAPWEPLYYPPEQADAILPLVDSLIEIIRGMPRQIAALVKNLPETEGPGDEPVRDEVDFLFGGIHGMIRQDLNALSSLLESYQVSGGESHGLEANQRLCELCADLKGKYGSALMGATASVVAQGLWSGVAIEPILFPEKEQEFQGTQELVAALREILAAIEELPRGLAFQELLTRWRQNLRVDPYALADLPALRGKIAGLLKQRNRRALYTGDYHQIRHREVLLSERINELETLHQRTWAVSGRPDSEELPRIYERLGQLLMEVAAILDARVLKTLIGEKTVNELRTWAGRSAPPATSLGSLVPLLAGDDLKIFLEMLLGSVRRRASLNVSAAVEEKAAVAIEAAGTRPSAPPVLKPAVISGDPGPALIKVRERLADLQSPSNPDWNAFRLTQRLLSKHGRIPAAMLDSIHPFLDRVRDELLPELKKASPRGGITPEAVRWLEKTCVDLCQAEPAPAQMQGETRVALERLLRFFDALSAAGAAVAGSRSS